MTDVGRTCPVCASAWHPTMRRYPSSDGGAFDYVACPGCGLQRMATPATAGVMEAAYPIDYYGEGETKFVGWLERLRDFFARGRARRARSLVGRTGHVADLGCGNGKFLSLMASSGWQITGTELPGPAWQRAQRVPGIRLLRADEVPLPLPAASVDLVTLWHVLEHVPDPRGLLTEARRVLRPDGWLIVEVPNVASWQARLTGAHWFHLDPPRHLFQFTPTALRSVCEDAGFAVARLQTLSWEMGVFGFAQSLLNGIMPHRDLLYASLRSGGARRHALLHRALSLLVLGLALVPSVFLAALEAACGSGSVVRILARPAAARAGG